MDMALDVVAADVVGCCCESFCFCGSSDAYNAALWNFGLYGFSI